MTRLNKTSGRKKQNDVMAKRRLKTFVSGTEEPRRRCFGEEPSSECRQKAHWNVILTTQRGELPDLRFPHGLTFNYRQVKKSSASDAAVKLAELEELLSNIY